MCISELYFEPQIGCIHLGKMFILIEIHNAKMILNRKYYSNPLIRIKYTYITTELPSLKQIKLRNILKYLLNIAKPSGKWQQSLHLKHILE